MKRLKLIGIFAFFAFLGAGIQHGQFHMYNSIVPHVHSNGVVHSH